MGLQWMILTYVVAAETAIAILLTLPSPKALKSRFVSIFKAQRNAILCLVSCFLYWCIYRVCKYSKEIQSIKEVEKRYKDQ